jgi:hypothetical protein
LTMLFPCRGYWQLAAFVLQKIMNTSTTINFYISL